ncbi:MAG: PfkB family carbohydrate kinase, partial [Ignavibacterium sp.]
TFIALSASYFAKKINLVSVVGDDFPTSAIEMLQKRNVNTAGLQIKQGEKTFFWSGRYHNDMNTRDTLDTQLNVLEGFDPIIPDEFQACEFLMLGNLAPSVQMTVIDRLKTRPKLVVLDTMNFWMDIAMPELKALLKKVDVLTINDEEARQLSGEYSLVRAAQKILDMGPSYLIIKKGEHGALLFNREQVFFAPALPLEDVFDPTGAGDSFAGGFIGYLFKTRDLSSESLKRAVIYGSTMASFCVEKFSTKGLEELSYLQIQDRFRQFMNLSRFDED